MQKLPDTRSIVAIDPTTRGIAFVFFENGRVLNWGERLRSPRANEVQAVEYLLRVCDAEVVVLEDAAAGSCRRRARIKALLQSITTRARWQVPVFEVAREDVRQAWFARGVTNKEAIAVEIAARFPELAIVLPPRRKRGANEDPRVNIFDAASLAIHALDPFPRRPLT